jgi:hypothetical protein
MVQPFVGTQYKERSISDVEFAYLDGLFKDYATKQGMTCYPTVN